jgi:hypothetical protein
MGERVSFRPLGRADIDLLYRWRSAQHVTPWFGPPPNREELNSYYERYLDGTAARAGHICLVEDRPVGFVESYRADDHPLYFANMEVDVPMLASGGVKRSVVALHPRVVPGAATL